MFASGSRNLAGLFAFVLAAVLHLVNRQTWADDLQCAADADCILTNFDCSECGRCPNSPPFAVPPRALKRLEKECRKHPPARLASLLKNGSLSTGPMPACSPCMSSLLQTSAPIYRAACVAGGCQAVVDFYQVITQPSVPLLQSEPSRATMPDDPKTCSSAEDCVLTNFDCTACGRCPGSPPAAFNGQALVQMEAKCRKHPPARLNSNPKQGTPRPKCGKCPPVDPARPIAAFRAACTEGQCQAISEPARVQKGSGD